MRKNLFLIRTFAGESVISVARDYGVSHKPIKSKSLPVWNSIELNTMTEIQLVEPL